MNMKEIKVTSMLDVITNSSSEVFILDTDDVKEINDWLDDNVSGYNPPTIASNAPGNPLMELVDYGDLFDLSTEKGKCDAYRCILGQLLMESGYYFQIEQNIRPKVTKSIVKKFCKFAQDNRDTINNHYREAIKESLGEYPKRVVVGQPDSGKKRSGETEIEYCLRKHGVSEYISYDMPSDLIKTFFDNIIYESDRKEIDKVLERLDAQQYFGKVCFSSECDNSIPYEDIEKILSTYPGERWHLG